MNVYDNRKHEQKRWKYHRIMQTLAQRDKERVRHSMNRLLNNVLGRIVEECGDPSCPIHGTQARANSN